MTTEKLSDRVERLQAPCRETDAEIAVALKIGARGLLDDDHEYLSAVRKHDECSPGTYWFHCRPGKSLRTAEHYTASIDAAVTLVPEGCGWFAGWGQIRPDEPMGGARITRNARFIGTDANYDAFADAEGATPAIALTAAALRARGL